MFLGVFFFSIMGCAKGPQEAQGELIAAQQRQKYPVYTSYRSIPGVTPEEIAAVEALRAQMIQAAVDSADHNYFVYAMNPSSEAFYNENGDISGFSARFCLWLSTLFGIPFEPALYEWGDLVDGLASGEVDFSGELTATDERREKYFMTEAIAERSIRYMRLTGSEDLGRIAKNRPLRYAFLEGTTTYTMVMSTLKDPVEPVLINDYDTAYRMLKDNSIDAFFDESNAAAAFDQYHDVTAVDFIPFLYSQVSLVTQNPGLTPIISIVDKALKNGGDRYLLDLYNQEQSAYLRHKFFMQLTEEEKAYISKHGASPIPIAMEYDNYPASFYNPREKEWQGIAIDILGEIEDLTGLSFKRIHDEPIEWPEILDMLERNEAALTAELIPSEERQGFFLWTDEPYHRDRYALLSNINFKDININEVRFAKVALIEGTAYMEVFRQWFPNHRNTVTFTSNLEAFDALIKGKVDLVMATHTQLLAITNYLEMPGFKANIIFNHTYESSFGFNINERLLCSIMSKAQRLVDTNMISERWIRKVFDYRRNMAQAQIPWLIGAAILLFCVVALLFILFLRRSQEGKRLELIVQDRTRELEIQKEAAITASKSKSDFLSNMSHEIRTPLNAIIGMTAIGGSSPDPDRKDYAFGKIADASTHLLGVINDILDMSKIEANKFELSSSEFNFEKLLQKVAGVVNFRIEEKHQTFTVRLDDKIPVRLAGDDQRLAQVITNLLGNAVKFTPERGDIHLNTYFVKEEKGLCTIKIEVIDTGIGISGEQQSRLFTSFEQAENSTSRKFGGTGLGLAISRRIVEMMGGKIWIESELGKGAAFVFTVLVRRGTEPSPEELDIGDFSAPGGEAAADRKTADIRVLVVDNGREERDYLLEIVRRYGFSCEGAGGEETAALLEKNGPYHLCFIDWQTLQANSDLLRRVKETQQDFSLVILISTTEWSEIEEKAKQDGLNTFLFKPLFPSAVVDCINKCLGRGRPQEVSSADKKITRLDGYRILLAEDVDINREIVQVLLEPTGLYIECAKNGVEAVEMFTKNPDGYDIIFMDVQMPEMDGCEATRRIRALDFQKAKEIPIIAMTANVFREDIDRCLAAGMNDHVGKPLDFDKILSKLKTWLAAQEKR
ncbi:hypothetical protein AGMMS50230_02670 [Spirochaetia bacterium]|nr:hypothetical protein AGMMS50230_02670 [Spirochaetia bacterium]